jgi:hypothetical protein
MPGPENLDSRIVQLEGSQSKSYQSLIRQKGNQLTIHYS